MLLPIDNATTQIKCGFYNMLTIDERKTEVVHAIECNNYNRDTLMFLKHNVEESANFYSNNILIFESKHVIEVIEVIDVISNSNKSKFNIPLN